MVHPREADKERYEAGQEIVYIPQANRNGRLTSELIEEPINIVGIEFLVNAFG